MYLPSAASLFSLSPSPPNFSRVVFGCLISLPPLDSLLLLDFFSDHGRKRWLKSPVVSQVAKSEDVFQFSADIVWACRPLLLSANTTLLGSVTYVGCSFLVNLFASFC